MVSRLHAVLGGLVVATALSLPASSAQAQGECKINDGSPYQLGGAKQYIIAANDGKKPSEIPNHLQGAVRNLTTEPEKLRGNEIGRQFLLARTYSLWLDRGDAENVMRRGDLGFEVNPDDSINLLMAIDSAVTYIINARPECEGTVDPYRSNRFTRLFNEAVQAVGDGDDAAAEEAANTALLLNSKDPRPWNVLGTVYSRRESMDSAKMAMRKVLEFAGDDERFQRTVQQTRFNLALMTIGEADALEGDTRLAKLAEAKTILDAYLEVSPDDANAKQALARLAAASGDTAAVAGIFRDMVENPDNYTDIQLFEAGAGAAAARQDEDAAALFENGLAKNAYHRDALFNLANVYFGANDPDKMLATVQKLVEVDPNNPMNWQLMAGAWQVKRRVETDEAKQRAYSDSIIKNIERRDNLNPHVAMSAAGQVGERYEVMGMLTNRGNGSSTFNLAFEFLNAEGEVVTSKDVPVGPVDSGTQTEFTVAVEEAGVVAYRYKLKQ